MRELGFGFRVWGFEERATAQTFGSVLCASWMEFKGRTRAKVGAVLLGLVILELSLGVGCGAKSESKRAAYFPDTGEVPGWSKSGETRTFPPDQLWQYIDGDAEKYIQAGVQQAFTTDYRYGGKIEAVADVFVMSDAAGAAKVFESQPATGSQPVRVGDAARLYKGSLTLRQDRYFIRLVAYQDAPEVPEVLVALGRSIANRLERK